jgi:hypothetical protein
MNFLHGVVQVLCSMRLKDIKPNVMEIYLLICRQKPRLQLVKAVLDLSWLLYNVREAV